MECILWAAAQVSRCAASATEDELSDDGSVEDGILGATEKEELRTLYLDNVLDRRDCPTVEVSARGCALENTRDDVDSSQDDQTISALRRIMEQSSQRSLRRRQVSVMLQARLDQRERQRQAEEMLYRQGQRNLMSKGIASERVALLPRDASKPMPTQINDGLATFRQQTPGRLEDKARKSICRISNTLLTRNGAGTSQARQYTTGLSPESGEKSVRGGLPPGPARQAETIPPELWNGQLPVGLGPEEAIVCWRGPGPEERTQTSCHQPPANLPDRKTTEMTPPPTKNQSSGYLHLPTNLKSPQCKKPPRRTRTAMTEAAS